MLDVMLMVAERSVNYHIVTGFMLTWMAMIVGAMAFIICQ